MKAGGKKGSAAPKGAPKPAKSADQYADRSMQPGKTSGSGRGGYKTK